MQENYPDPSTQHPKIWGEIRVDSPALKKLEEYFGFLSKLHNEWFFLKYGKSGYCARIKFCPHQENQREKFLPEMIFAT